MKRFIQNQQRHRQNDVGESWRQVKALWFHRSGNLQRQRKNHYSVDPLSNETSYLQFLSFCLLRKGRTKDRENVTPLEGKKKHGWWVQTWSSAQCIHWTGFSYQRRKTHALLILVLCHHCHKAVWPLCSISIYHPQWNNKARKLNDKTPHL